MGYKNSGWIKHVITQPDEWHQRFQILIRLGVRNNFWKKILGPGVLEKKAFFVFLPLSYPHMEQFWKLIILTTKDWGKLHLQHVDLYHSFSQLIPLNLHLSLCTIWAGTPSRSNRDQIPHDLRSAHKRGLVLATSPLKSLHEGTGRRDLSQEQFTWSILRNNLQGLVPKIQTSL